MKQYRIIYLSILLLSCYSRQVPRRGCNAKEPEDGDDDGEVVVLMMMKERLENYLVG